MNAVKRKPGTLRLEPENITNAGSHGASHSE